MFIHDRYLSKAEGFGYRQPEVASDYYVLPLWCGICDNWIDKSKTLNALFELFFGETSCLRGFQSGVVAAQSARIQFRFSA